MFHGHDGDFLSPGIRSGAGGGVSRYPGICEEALDEYVAIGHELGAQFAVYWPGTLGYYTQGAVEETQTLRWFAEALNAACDADIEIAAK